MREPTVAGSLSSRALGRIRHLLGGVTYLAQQVVGYLVVRNVCLNLFERGFVGSGDAISYRPEVPNKAGEVNGVHDGASASPKDLDNAVLMG
jgi:hypothetical protein